MKKIIASLAFALICCAMSAQIPLIHSHNDYSNPVPFWQAYSQGAYSIEADVHFKDGVLLVGHDDEDLKPYLSFEELYVKPIVAVYTWHGGKPHEGDFGLQLMVELKTATEPTLTAVVEELSKYPEVFDPKVNPNAVRTVITGNVPDPEDFGKWPEHIYFDGDIRLSYTPEQLKRVGQFSSSFGQFSSWNGKGAILDSEEKALYGFIDKVHKMGKRVRLWGAPEGVTPYYVFMNMGIDFFNTDEPQTCAAFYKKFYNKNFRIGEKAEQTDGVSGTHKLDKITRDFGGFKNDKLLLSKGIDVYEPTYASDNGKTKINNVIFLIGDGMGLNQITAAAYANGGLSMMQMKNIGIQSNNAEDEFTTDSAAAGSALATGVRHKNRHISAKDDGTENPSLSDWAAEKGKAVGIVTLGNLVDATPAAFYGHCAERDSADILTRCLLDGKVDLLCGSGLDEFTKRHDGVDLVGELEKMGYSFEYAVDDINKKDGKVICIDESMGKAAEEASLGLLAKTTRESIEKLSAQDKKGFFLMVEGAKIDYAGHSNCLPGSILETLSFDMAVAEALKFADRDGHTLVVVTADHETGGLVLLDGNLETGYIMGTYTTDDHTPSMLPVFAYGPRSASFNGTYENTEIARIIKRIVK